MTHWWRRLAARWDAARRRPRSVVTSDDGYRLWASTYASPPNRFQRLEHEALCALLPPLTGRRVLDLGCGTGRTSRALVERGAAAVVGVDRSRPMLERARAAGLGAVTWVEADAARLPLGDAAMDLVVSALVFGHVANLRAAIDEAARVLRPGGSLVISDFHPDATQAGLRRTVRDPASGLEHDFEQHLHLLGDYAAALAPHGMVIDALREPHHDGRPVAFVLRARKPPAAGEPGQP